MAIFMKYGGVDGEVTAKGYEKWIQLDLAQFGVGRGISSSVAGSSMREASAPNVSEIVASKQTDGASGKLFKESFGGKAQEVKIDFTQTDNKGTHIAYLKYILTDTLVSSYSIGGSSEGRPAESLSLNFTKIDMEYISVNDKFEASTTGHVIYDLSKATSS